MTLTVRFSTPLTFGVPPVGATVFADDLLALANGSVIDVLSIATPNSTGSTYSEKLVSFDALDPARTTTVALTSTGSLGATYLANGNAVREFFNQSGNLVMRTDGVTGTSSTPVMIDPAHPGKAFYEGSFNADFGTLGLNTGGFVVA